MLKEVGLNGMGNTESQEHGPLAILGPSLSWGEGMEKVSIDRV